MRRIPATVLLLLINLSLISPLLFATTDSKIAACCRRDGKHHCAKMAQEAHADDDPGAIRITATATCPLYSGAKGAPAFASIAIGPPLPVIGITLKTDIDGVVQAEVQRLSSESRSAQKRGPPSLLV